MDFLLKMLNQLERFTHTVNLPTYLSQRIIKAGDTTIVSFFLSLKSIYCSSVILNYKKRTSELSAHTGLCSRSVKDYIARLVNQGLAVIESNDLRIYSKRKLFTLYELPIPKRINYNEYKTTKVKELKDIIRAQAIKDNQLQQNFELKKEMKQDLKIMSKGYATKVETNQRIENQMTFNKINPKVKLSQQGIAKCFNAKYKSTGNYWSNKLSSKGLISLQKQKPELVMKNVSPKAFIQLAKANDDRALFRTESGKVFQKHCNQIRVNINRF